MKDTTNKHRIGSYLLSKIPMIILQQITKIGFIIPYYHMISEEEIQHVKNLYRYKNVKEFNDDLDFLLRYYSPIALQDLLNCLKKDHGLPRNSFLLTFDDGFREMFDIVAPILIKKGIPAAFFVSSDFIDNRRLCYQHKISIIIESLKNSRSAHLERSIKHILEVKGIKKDDLMRAVLAIGFRQEQVINEISRIMDIDFESYLLQVKPYLTSCQIRKMIEDGFAIGGHSVDHPYYFQLSVSEQLKQTIESVRFVREKFSLNYGAFAFPHTDWRVSREFFALLKDSCLVDVSFGTGGFYMEPHLHNFQRISLEKPFYSANRILAYEYGRTMKKRLRGEDRIIRI
jgi:hypothetical protein